MESQCWQFSAGICAWSNGQTLASATQWDALFPSLPLRKRCHETAGDWPRDRNVISTLLEGFWERKRYSLKRERSAT